MCLERAHVLSTKTWWKPRQTVNASGWKEADNPHISMSLWAGTSTPCQALVAFSQGDIHTQTCILALGCHYMGVCLASWCSPSLSSMEQTMNGGLRSTFDVFLLSITCQHHGTAPLGLEGEPCSPATALFQIPVWKPCSKAGGKMVCCRYHPVQCYQQQQQTSKGQCWF